MKAALAFLFLAIVSPGQTWHLQTSGTTASLRGVSAVSTKVVWASGSDGVWLRTVDGGATWQTARGSRAEALDFRGVRGVDQSTAYLMSSGAGDKSRVYKTTDGGGHWTLLLTKSRCARLLRRDRILGSSPRYPDGRSGQWARRHYDYRRWRPALDAAVNTLRPARRRSLRGQQFLPGGARRSRGMVRHGWTRSGAGAAFDGWRHLVDGGSIAVAE